jgi:hypothetical protein
MQCRVQRQCEATAAAPAQRAPQRTLANGEGGAAKPGRALPSGLARSVLACGAREANVANGPQTEVQRTAALHVSRVARSAMEQVR